MRPQISIHDRSIFRFNGNVFLTPCTLVLSGRTDLFRVIKELKLQNVKKYKVIVGNREIIQPEPSATFKPNIQLSTRVQ